MALRLQTTSPSRWTCQNLTNDIYWTRAWTNSPDLSHRIVLHLNLMHDSTRKPREAARLIRTILKEIRNPKEKLHIRRNLSQMKYLWAQQDWGRKWESEEQQGQQVRVEMPEGEMIWTSFRGLPGWGKREEDEEEDSCW